MPDYEPVIGLEVHLQLSTATKMFCGCSTRFGAEENSQVCPVCLGLPGVLPVANKRAIEYGVMAGLALNCAIAQRMKFDRKNYYYPDLPKNFQISQYDQPLASSGYVEIGVSGETRRIGITRAHLEEDAGKLIHEGATSLVDLNRTGTPLLEIVSEPDIGSPEEAYEYLVTLKSIFRYLGISDCNMEEGSLRCDANVSIRPRGEKRLGTKTELKNMNSFKGVRDALLYEIARQTEAVRNGERIVQQTRLWDPERGKTVLMRTKEEAHDYRYFPEPDLPPFEISAAMVARLSEALPELPRARQKRFVAERNLSAYDAAILTAEKATADFFERCMERYRDAKTVANWIMGDLANEVNARGLSDIAGLGIEPAWLTEMLMAIDEGRISGKMAKDLLRRSVDTKVAPMEMARTEGLAQITDASVLEEVVIAVMHEHPRSVEDYRGGKEPALMFLVGQVMKRTKGKANPRLTNELLKRKLSGMDGEEKRERTA